MSTAPHALTFSLAMTNSAHVQAEQASQRYWPYYEKVEQCYLNSLALYAVQYYLQLHDYPVEDYGSCPPDYVDQALSDGTMLSISGYGAIACIYLSGNETHLDIPVHSQDGPIAYVVVQLDDELSDGLILGFLPQTDQAIVSIDDLQPLAALTRHLDRFNPLRAATTQLNQWWQRSFGQGWEIISELTAPEDENFTPAWNTRSTLDRPTPETTRPPVDGLTCQKTLQLGTDTFALVLTMERFETESEPSVNFEVRLSPNVGQAYLPENVQLIASDEADNVFSTLRSRDHSPALELRFRADPGDRFKLKIDVNDITLTEVFEV